VTAPQPIKRQVGDCAVSGFRAGSGEPLVYLHGAGGGGDWLPFMESLSQNFEVIAFNHPGFGESDDPAWLRGIDDLAYFYLELIEDLGVDKAHIVGSSIGGWIALEMAIRSTERIATLSLSAPAGIHVRGLPKADIFILPPDQFAYSLFHDKAMADVLVGRLQAQNEAEQAVAYKNRTTSAKVSWQPYLYNPRLRNWLQRVRVPTSLIWGREDCVIPLGYATAFQELLPNASLTVIEECGHLPHLEKEGAFVGALVDFIDGARS